MSQGILAIAEQIDGVFRKVTYEALSEGKRIAGSLGCDLTAVVLGAGVEDISKPSTERVPDGCIYQCDCRYH